MREVRRITTGAKFSSLADFNPEVVQVFLRSLRKANKFGHRTYNHYLQSIDTFCNWCVATKRLVSNPLAGIERLNTAVDVRRQRRALTAEELSRMIESARSSGVRVQGYGGEQRTGVCLSYLTGPSKEGTGKPDTQQFRSGRHASDADGRGDCLETPSQRRVAAAPRVGGDAAKMAQGPRPRAEALPAPCPPQSGAGWCGRTWSGPASPTRRRRGSPISMRRGGIRTSLSCSVTGHRCRRRKNWPDTRTSRPPSGTGTHIGIKDQARAVAAIPVPKKLSGRRRQAAGKRGRRAARALQLGCRRGAFAVSEWQWRHKRQTPKP